MADLTYTTVYPHDIVEQVLVDRSNDLRLKAECRQSLQHVHSADGLALACPALERRAPPGPPSQRHPSFETHTACRNIHRARQRFILHQYLCHDPLGLASCVLSLELQFLDA
jgi:hypothetical protein